MSLYLISDTHLGHRNIIKYCDRPFNSLEEMNSTIISNWNEVVGYDDVVLFGGDLAMTKPEKAIEYARKLNGNMVILSGNHDDFDKWRTPYPVLESEYFDYNYFGEKYEFYYTHWPPRYNSKTERKDSRVQPHYTKPPEWFDNWVIHGHTHNNDLKNFPFINNEEKTINVSSEVINYTPLEINDLIKIIQLDNRYETIHDVPDKVL